MIFFFQAEDGIRDTSVTGVQTCALPISSDTGKGCIGPESSSLSFQENELLSGPMQPLPVSDGGPAPSHKSASEIGRASCRERVWSGVVAGLWMQRTCTIVEMGTSEIALS